MGFPLGVSVDEQLLEIR